MFVRAGERCAHCGQTTPLGGRCPECRGPICTRSARIRRLAQEGLVSAGWGCPVMHPAPTDGNADRDLALRLLLAPQS